jgi:DNA-binding phage protein
VRKLCSSRLVNATIGFEGLASRMGKPSKSLHRMLSPRGNPSIENFFDIVLVLQRETHPGRRSAASTLKP